jgi:hypothetical protein
LRYPVVSNFLLCTQETGNESGFTGRFTYESTWQNDGKAHRTFCPLSFPCCLGSFPARFQNRFLLNRAEVAKMADEELNESRAGRPTKYSEQTVSRLCGALADGMSIK